MSQGILCRKIPSVTALTGSFLFLLCCAASSDAQSRLSFEPVDGPMLRTEIQPVAPAEPAGQPLPQTISVVPPAAEARPADEPLPPPRKTTEPNTAPAAKAPGFVGPDLLAGPKEPISLLAALRLAQTSNLDIAQAREAVNRATAALQAAEVKWLPDLSLGSDYTNHQGQIAKTEGNVETVDKSALFVYGGPQVTWVTADILIGPLVARQLAAATRAGLQRIDNDTLGRVADAYLNVLRFRRRLAAIGEALEFLTAERLRLDGEQFKGMLPLLRDFVEVGGREALRSEEARVEVEVLRLQEAQRGAIQDLEVATADLNRLLRLDPRMALAPVEDFRYPIPLPGQEWLTLPSEQLVAFALNNRPELAESQALVQAALARVRESTLRPYLPNLSITYNWGGFGGGPDIHPASVGGYGLSGVIRHFDTRGDFDGNLFWRLRNFGLGDRADLRQQQAASRQSIFSYQQVTDRVVAQVVQTQEQVEGWRARLAVSRSALFDASGAPTGPVFRSLRLNFERIRGGEGRPLEVLDSIRGLLDLLTSYGEDMTNYEQAQFRLLIALGMPPAALLDPSRMPLPPGMAKPAGNPPPKAGQAP